MEKEKIERERIEKERIEKEETEKEKLEKKETEKERIERLEMEKKERIEREKNQKEIGKLIINIRKVSVYEIEEEDKDDNSEFFIKITFGENSQKTKTISNTNELNFDEGLYFYFKYMIIKYDDKI
jgi:hypothetical protein